MMVETAFFSSTEWPRDAGWDMPQSLEHKDRRALGQVEERQVSRCSRRPSLHTQLTTGPSRDWRTHE